jgi:hypothetical protein
VSTKWVGYTPLVEMDDRQRREFHEALLNADSFDSTFQSPAAPMTRWKSRTLPRVTPAERTA